MAVQNVKNLLHLYLVVQHMFPITELDVNESENILMTDSSDGNNSAVFFGKFCVIIQRDYLSTAFFNLNQ